MKRAVELATETVLAGRGGPFGAVVVKGGEIIGEGQNRVLGTNDPTAHAEVVAIRAACQRLGNFSLAGAELYTSAEPCPMCLGAIYWARLDRFYFSATRDDAAAIGFDDAAFYREVALPLEARSLPAVHLFVPEAVELFELWKNKGDKIEY
jgi:tRNA(Arg) A34 adenosine deaminase TadA